MLKYIIKTKDLFEVLDTLYRVLGIGISFYDYRFNEISFLDADKQQPYCRLQRKQDSFLAKCKESDYKLFQKSRRSKKIQVQRCHCHLWDGCVPLYDDNDEFLGIIIYGQVRPANQPCPETSSKKRRALYMQLPALRLEEMENIGKLIKLISDPIIYRQMIGFRQLGWSEKIQHYIDMHLHESISISNLAELTGCSESFISHRFYDHFQKTPRQYILHRKMEIAQNLLKEGNQVRQVAEKLGFYDEFHFSKTFKKHVALSPRDFKKMNNPR